MAEYSKIQLVGEANARGFDKVSGRLVDDWASLGLLDRAAKHGLGYARGSVATWPEDQLQLFLALLDQRRDAPNVLPLLNVPVATWLLWGDAFVPRRQMRRGMETWANGIRDAPSSRARAGARNLVEAWAQPDAKRSDKRRLVSLLDAHRWDGAVDSTGLRSLAKSVFEPAIALEGTRPLGFGLTGEGYARALAGAYQAFSSMATLPDSLFEWARYTCLTGLVSYAQAQPQLSVDPTFGANYGVLDLEALVSTACKELARVLGIACSGTIQAADGDLVQPSTWEANQFITINHVFEIGPGGRARIEFDVATIEKVS
jgi:hypothetical protein